MVTQQQRRLVLRMLRFRLWVEQRDLFGLVDIYARWGTRWLLEKLKREHPVDDLHHAPACPANHYHRCRLVFQRCTCGAEYYEQQKRAKQHVEKLRAAKT